MIAGAGTNTLGGFVGTNGANLNGTNSANPTLFNTGTITLSGSGTLTSIIGGFVGSNSGTLNNLASVALNNLTTTGSNVGGFVGSNSGTISNSKSNVVNTTGVTNIGGFVGINSGAGAITNSSSITNVTGSGSQIGGFAGTNNNTTSSISSSSSSGNVTSTGNSTNNIGGFIGVNFGSISNSAAGTSLSSVTVTINGTTTNTIGGFAGTSVSGSTLTSINNYANLVIAGAGTNTLGGFVGTNGANLNGTNSANPTLFNTGTITLSGSGTLTSTIGGFVGSNSGTLNNLASVALNNLATTGSSVGGFVGSNSGALSNVISNVINMTGVSTIGGLVGSNSNTITNGVSVTNVTGSGSQIGGLVGRNNGISSAVINSSSSGSVTATGNSTNSIGGLVGQNDKTVSGSYSTGNVLVTGNTVSDIGGSIGNNIATAVVSNLFSIGSVTTQGSAPTNIGGLIGLNTGANSVTSSFSTSPVNVSTATGIASNIGGLVGSNAGGSISSAYSEGAVTITGGTFASSQVGGLVGSNSSGSITNSYSRSALTGKKTTNIGGFVGQNSSSTAINNTYSLGLVSGTTLTAVGGFVGSNTAPATISNSFWDTALSGLGGTGAGSNAGSIATLKGGCFTGSSCANGGTSNLSAQNTYTATGWDFSTVWGINAGQSYPYLQNINNWVLQGSTPTTSSAISLVAGGAVIANSTTDANGKFTFILNNANLSNTSSFIVYLSGGSTVGNLVASNINNGNSMIDFSLLANTIQVGETTFPTVNLSNSALATAVGGLTIPAILYSVSSGNNLLLANNTYTNTLLQTSNSTSYTVDGTINTTQTSSVTFNGPTAINAASITTTGNQLYNAPVTIGADTVLDSGVGTITYNSTLNSNGTPHSLTLNGTGAKIFNAVVGGSSALANLITGTTTINTTGITTTGNQTYTGDVTVGVDTILAAGGGNFLFNSNVTGVGRNLTLQGTGSATHSFTVGNNLTLNNLIITGGTGINNLTVATNTPTQAWTLAGVANGSIASLSGLTGSLTFSSIQNVTGGSNIDTFANNGNFTGTLNGAGGDNTINMTSNPVTSTWTITGVNQGIGASLAGFSHIQHINLATVSNNNVFNVQTGGSLTSINAGSFAGNNTLSYASYIGSVLITPTATTGMTTVSNIKNFVGNGINTTLSGVTALIISATNAGSADTTYNWSGVGNLGSGNSFQFINTGAITGNIIGNTSGSNSLDLSNLTSSPIEDVTLTTLGANHGYQGTVGVIGGTFNNIDVIANTSSANTLTGLNNNTQWILSGAHSGSLTSPAALSFSGFNNIIGGTANDIFTINNGAVFNNINGGLGNNILTYVNYTGPVSITPTAATAITAVANIQNFVGNDGTSGANTTLSGVNSLVISSTNAGTADSNYNFSGIGNLGSGNSFQFTNTGAITGNIIGNIIGSNNLDLSGLTGSPIENVTLTSLGTNHGYQGTVGVIDGTFNNIDVIANTSSANTLTGLNNNSSWTLNGSQSGTLVTPAALTFSGFANINGGSGINTFSVTNGANFNNINSGSSGNNTLTYASYTGLVSITPSSATGVTALSNIQTFIGNDGAGTANTTLTGVNDLIISDTNTGSADSVYHFSSIGNLGAGNYFQFIGNGNITGNLTGNASGINSLDFSGLTSVLPDVVLTSTGSNHGFSGSATPIGGVFNNIDAITHGNSLTGTNANTDWIINGVNSGTLQNTQHLNFFDFQTLRSGSGNDNFILNSGSSIHSLDGGAGVNSLTVASGDSNWTITAEDGGNIAGLVNSFNSIGDLVGSSNGAAIFKFSGPYAITGSIDGGNTNFINSIDVSAILPMVNLTLGPKTGNVLNEGIFYTANNNVTFVSFSQIQFALGNYGRINTNPSSYMNSLVKTGQYSGIISDPFVFNQFLLPVSPIPPSPIPIPPEPINSINPNIANIITGVTENSYQANIFSTDMDLYTLNETSIGTMVCAVKTNHLLTALYISASHNNNSSVHNKDCQVLSDF